MTTAAIEKKHKHFTMGAGTTYRHVGLEYSALCAACNKNKSLYLMQAFFIGLNYHFLKICYNKKV